VAKTQGALLTELRDRLDETTARQWTDPMLRGWINDAARDIARKSETLQDREDVAVVSGTREYTLPADIIRVHRAEYKATGDTLVYPLEYRDFNSMDGVWHTQQEVSEATPMFFTMWGYPPTLKMVLYPTPSIAGVVKVFYYKVPANLATDGSDAGVALDCPEGWEDLILDFAEYRALRRDADPRWRESKELYDENLGAMFDTTRRWSDQAGVIVNDSGFGVPAWLVGGDF
jgi:hypothetical protein